MIKAGIIGCGKMAESHARCIKRIAGAQLAAVCDLEPLMAQDMAGRFAIDRHFTSVDEMLSEASLDVVHITTPPQSHHPIAKICLNAGCNVYVEKPFTINTADAVELISLAQYKNLKITAGHNHQFTPAMVRMRDLVREGYLGGKPIHIESHFCYELINESYARAFLGDNNHWVRKLPGTLLQNIISHGISKIAEFLSGDDPSVIAQGFTSEFLKNIGENNIVDEVRVIIKDEENTTAYYTFSSQIGPSPHQFRLYGPKNSLIVDDDHQIVIKENNKELKSYARYFIPPFDYAKQYLGNFGINFKMFLAKDFHLPNDSGLQNLISAFYKSIENEGPLPLSYREIILTSRIMDDIFEQVQTYIKPPNVN